MWARRPELAREIARQQAQQRLPARHQPAANLTATLAAWPRCSHGAEQVFVAVPSQSLRENLVAIRTVHPAGRHRRQS